MKFQRININEIAANACSKKGSTDVKVIGGV